MRQFNCTGNNFKGEAKITYNDNNLLVIINVSETNMTHEQVYAFKNLLPLTIEQLEAGGHGLKGVTIVETEYAVTFEMWWVIYAKKINKIRCIPLWNKLSKSEQVQAFMGVKNYDNYLRKESWRTKADPENYLRNHMWENEWR